MEKRTFSLTLADGTSIADLELNGNCYVSSKKVTADKFTAAAMESVKITCSDGTEKTRTDLELVSVWKDGTKYFIAFSQKSQAEVTLDAIKAQLSEANDAIAELSELVATMSAQ